MYVSICVNIYMCVCIYIFVLSFSLVSLSLVCGCVRCMCMDIYVHINAWIFLSDFLSFFLSFLFYLFDILLSIAQFLFIYRQRNILCTSVKAIRNSSLLQYFPLIWKIFVELQIKKRYIYTEKLLGWFKSFTLFW